MRVRLSRLWAIWLIVGLLLSGQGRNLVVAATSHNQEDPYTPSGILLDTPDARPNLNHLNLRLPGQPLDAAADLPPATPAGSPDLIPVAGPDVAPDGSPGELSLLAAGLDNDPKLIFDYVHNNYDTITSWGLLRGPVELIQAKAGNPFDQAFLLASLLNAAGFETRFVFGTINMPVAQGLNWAGIVNEAALWSAFASGGIPSQVASGKLRLNHVWVKVKVGETWHPLDPSFKSYQAQAGWDLAQVMGYNKNDFTTAAQSGATVTDNYAQKINSGRIEEKLQGYALNLLTAIRAADPALRLDQVIGGRAIVPQQTTVLPAELPYTVESVSGETTGIPVDRAFKLRVQAPGLDQTIIYANIANQRLTYFYVPATAADAQKIQQAGGIYNVYPAYGVNMKPELRLGETLLTTGSPLMLGGYQQVTFTLQTAWKDSNGNPINLGFSRYFYSSNWYALALRNGDMSDAALNRCNEGLGEQLMSGVTPNSEPALGQALHCLGMGMHSEYGHLRRLAAQAAGVIDPLNIGAMVAGQTSLVEYEAGGQQRPLRVQVGSYYVDAQLNLGGVVSIYGDENRERGYASQIAWTYSAIEGAIMEQLQGNPGISTVRVIDAANREGQKLYHLTKGNVASILATLQYPSYIENSLNADVQNGYEVIVPERNVTINQWTGVGWYSYDPQSGSMGTWLNGSVGFTGSEVLFPEQSISGGSGSIKSLLVGSEAWDAATASDEEIKQYVDTKLEPLQRIDLQVDIWRWEWERKHPSPRPFDPLAPVSRTPGPDPLSDTYVADQVRAYVKSHHGAWLQHEKHVRLSGIRIGDPVDPVTGAYLYDRADIAYGSLGPATLFARHYTSARSLYDGPLGRGWTHNYAQRLDRASVWPRSQSDAPARQAALAVAGLYPGLDIATAAAGALPHINLTIGSESTDWTAGQSVNNAWAWTRADGSQDRFARQADGTFGPVGPGYARLAFDAQGQATLTLPNGAQLRFDAAGRLVAQADPTGNRATLTYDGAGHLVTVTDAAGRRLTLSYTGDRLTRVTEPAGAVHRYEHNPAGLLTAYTDPAGRTYRYEYDAQARMVSYFNAAGERIITNAYDALGRVASQANCLGGNAVAAYGDGRNTFTDHAGRPFVFEHTRQGWVSRVADALGNAYGGEYDTLGRLIRLRDERGQTWRFAYDAHGNLLSTADPAGKTWTLAYDSADRLVEERDPLGRRHLYTYDANGNLTGYTDPPGAAAAFGYNGQGQLTTLTDPLGRVTTYQYDAQGNVTKVLDALNAAWSAAYDALGRTTRLTDPNNHSTALRYDPAGDVIETQDPLGAKTAYEYRERGVVAKVTDPLGHATVYEYNPLLSLTKVTDPAGGVTRYTYDPSNRLTGETAANGSAWGRGYDAAGRLISETDPLGRSAQYELDAAGARTVKRDPDGALTRYAYDAVGRLARLSYADGSQIAFAYNEAGELVEATEAGRAVGFTRDPAGRVTSVAYQAPDYALAYTYDKVGNRTGLTMTSGGQSILRLAYAYDAADQLTALTDLASGHVVAYRYDPAGLPVAVNAFNGAQTSYSYDAANQPVRVTAVAAGGRPLYDYTYTYDAAGNTLGRAAAGPGALSETYKYTPLDQLAEVRAGQAVVSYAYDTRGNRTGLTAPAGATSFVYDAAGELTRAGERAFTYDAAGRRTGQTDSRGATAYQYSRDGRLTGVNLPWGEQWRYGYDYAGRRVTEQGPAGARRFAYDGWQVIAEQAPDGRWEATYAYGANGLVMRHRAGADPARAATSYHTDGRGNVAALVDANGVRRDAYRLDPYGLPGRAAGLDANPYRFDGADGVRADSASPDLYLMGFRVYDAATGQFLTRDPVAASLGDPIGRNAYLHARGNPLRYRDPLGLQYDPSTGLPADAVARPDGSVEVVLSDGTAVSVPPTTIEGVNSAVEATGSSG